MWDWTRTMARRAATKGLIKAQDEVDVIARIPLTDDGKSKAFVPFFTLIDLTGAPAGASK